jgi:HEAT repeat protein
MDFYRFGCKLTHTKYEKPGTQEPGIRKCPVNYISCVLSCMLSLILLISGCGERENKDLVNARIMIQQDKYKESQDVNELRSYLNAALQDDSKNPEALCPLKALDIIKSDASTSERQKAISDILSLVKPIEDEIKALEAIEKDLLTDDDREKLEKLNRKWEVSLEPTALILKSQTDWINDVGRPAIDLLIELLMVSNPYIQDDIVNLFVSLKDISFEPLLEALQNESSIVRRYAIISLGRIGDDRAVEPIANLLDDQDPGVRFYIPVALDMIGGEKMTVALHKALKNEMAQVRMASANILGRIEDETSIDSLMELLADDNSYVKSSATNAITKIGKPAVPKLIAALETRAENISLPPTDFVGEKIGDEYKKVLSKRASLQVLAASILGNLKDERAIESLLEAMRRETGAEATEDEKSYAESVRSGAASALIAMGPAIVEHMIDILESTTERENARENAASILGSVGDKRAVEPLIEALKDQLKSVRAAAASSLGTLRDRRATLPLIEALSDPDPVTRANAVVSLGTMKDTIATQPLIDVVKDKTEREKIRTEAIIALGTIKDTAALEILVKVLVDEYEKDSVRKSAASALRTMENAWASEPLIALLKGEIVQGIFMPQKGTVSKWLKQEGDEDITDRITRIVEISTEDGKMEINAPSSGTLVKIYVKEGEEAEANTLLGIISYEDREIEQEERSSIRSAAASALGKVKGDGALAALERAAQKDKSAAVRKNAVSSLWELDKADGRSTLVDVLDDDDSGIVRSNAALGLGKGNLKGAEAVPTLIDALEDDKYESTRVQAAWSLGEIKDKRSIDPLIDVIVEGRNGEPEADAVVNAVITALDKIAGPAVEPLIDVLQDDSIDEVPRSKAARILGLIQDVKSTEPLIEELKGESVVVRSEVAKAFGLIEDRRAVEPLIEVLQDQNEWVTTRANAVTSLGQLKDERAIEPLLDALQSKVPAIYSNAVVALGLLKDKRATEPLIQILEDKKEDDAIRNNAISSLSSIGDTRAVDTLLSILESDAESVRQNAASALGALEADEAVEPLMAILGDVNESFALRANAAESLGKIGDKRPVPLLRERLGDMNESDTVWNKVAEAAGEIKVPQLPPLVNKRARDTWEAAALRSAAFMALTASQEDFSVLLEMLDNATKEIRSGAAIALGKSGKKEAVAPLVDKLLNDAEEIVRRDSAKGLASLADPDSEQALIKGLDDATDSVKIQSALALGNIKGSAGVQALMNVLQDTAKARAVRANAAIALGNAGREEAVPALREAIKNNLANIHFEAALALQKITGEDLGYKR